MEEKRRILHERCAEMQSSLRSTDRSNSQLTAELASCRGQLAAVHSRLDHVEQAAEVASRRAGELQLINANLKRDVDLAEQQVD